jgi:hypothetical protein
MSKLFMMNRMRYSPAAGDIWGTLAKVGGNIVKGAVNLFTSKGAKAAAAAAKNALKNPVVTGALAAGAGGLAGALLTPTGGGAPGGASGHWHRRRKGITGAELRGFHKVARLLHKEGMVVKHARRGK